MNRATETVTIELDLAEINQILGALGALPYQEVYQLIAKLHATAEDQLAGGIENDQPGGHP